MPIDPAKPVNFIVHRGDEKDPGVELDVVSGEPRETTVDAAVNNSFGFGGHNVSLLFTKA